MDPTVPRIAPGRAPDLPERFGRYRVDDFLAGGGMGRVYRATDPALDRRVAIKTLAAGRELTEFFAARFRQEGRAAARINHPGVVQVYDQGIEAGTAYLVMEYVPGGSLHHRIKEDGPLGPKAWTALAEELLGALQAVHRADILHRDIKPRNVFLTLTGQAKLGDFGIAHLESDLGLTETGDVLGTIVYMAPECTEGQGATTSSDLYSVGRTLLFAATGETRPVALPGGFAPDLQRWIDRLTVRDPDQRIATTEEARAALREVMPTEREARSDSVPPAEAPRRLPGVTAVPVILALLVAGLAFWPRSEPAGVSPPEPAPTSGDPAPQAGPGLAAPGELPPDDRYPPRLRPPQHDGGTRSPVNAPAPSPEPKNAPDVAAPAATPAEPRGARPSPLRSPAPPIATVHAAAPEKIVADSPFTVTAKTAGPAGSRAWLHLRVGERSWTRHAMAVGEGGWVLTLDTEAEWLPGARWYVELVDADGRSLATDGSRTRPRPLIVR